MNQKLRHAEDRVRAAYDRVPYPAHPDPNTHPDLLAVFATLYGLEPAAPERCSVLELGCSDGGNLLPMAHRLRESRFVGIDLSPRQIEAGRKLVEEMQLSNLELHEGSLLDFEESFGRFDYIIAHGIFSWVEHDVQEKIFAICSEHLADNGIAYISYNTLPGWHLRSMVREAMLYHTRHVGDPLERSREAIELVRFLADTVPKGDDPHSLFLNWSKEYLEKYREQPSYLVHEYLEDTNTPIYFRDFMKRAESHDLQLLAESERQTASVQALSPEAAELFSRFARGRVDMEQYVDFWRNRAFRRTLLCHGERSVDPHMNPERFESLRAASPVKPAEPDTESKSSAESHGWFETPRGHRFSAAHPAVAELLSRLGAVWPESLAVAELKKAGSPAELTADILWHLFHSGVVDLRPSKEACTHHIAERPLASSLARRQATRGTLVANLLHHPVRMDDPVARLLLTHLDGRNDVEALTGLLETELREGRLELELNGEALPEEASPRRALGMIVTRQLERMARYALLKG